MAVSNIAGKDGTADFLIATISYKCFLDMFRFREVVEMTSADTFCVEGSADQDPGRSQLVFELSGIGKKGIAAAGPLIPCPQNVAIVATFSTGCFLTFSANFSEANADRLVNANMRIGARGLSKGTYALTWVIS